MRSLNTSLPSSTPRPQPPEQLLQHFKAAALSVTNLYKHAACEQAQARQTGYQEALEDLLHFLDRENLGLGDGEGWKVRQWATEKCDGTASQNSDDDDRADTEKPDRNSTPATARKEPPSSEPVARQPPATALPSTPRPDASTPSLQDGHLSTPAVFTFTAAPNFPQCQELDMDLQSSDGSAPPSQDVRLSVSPSCLETPVNNIATTIIPDLLPVPPPVNLPSISGPRGRPHFLTSSTYLGCPTAGTHLEEVNVAVSPSFRH